MGEDGSQRIAGELAPLELIASRAEPDEYALQAVDSDAVQESVRTELEGLGQPLRELREEERSLRVAYWVGLQLDAENVDAAVSSKFNGTVETVGAARN